MTVNKAQDSNSIDLEKLFYEQNIDLSEFFKIRKNTHKKNQNFSLEPYEGVFGIDQKNIC